jgi:hypothetical protein
MAQFALTLLDIHLPETDGLLSSIGSPLGRSTTAYMLGAEHHKPDDPSIP